jgi:hypothetical protein
MDFSFSILTIRRCWWLSAFAIEICCVQLWNEKGELPRRSLFSFSKGDWEDDGNYSVSVDLLFFHIIPKEHPNER